VRQIRLAFYLVMLFFAVSASGCQCVLLQNLPDDFAGALYDCPFAQAIHDVCSCPGSSHGCGTVVTDVSPEIRPEEYPEKCDDRAVAERSEPLPVYEAPQPPKFLPVPTRPVFSTVNMQAPTPRRGEVEVPFGSQLNFPGQD